jgi:hypothetical protein
LKVLHDHPEDLSIDLVWSRVSSRSPLAFLVEFNGVVCRRCGWRSVDGEEFSKFFAKCMISLRQSVARSIAPGGPDETRLW